MDNTNSVYLVMVTANNNNKFYRMIPNGTSFTVEFGRIGNGGFQTATYPINQWTKKYNEKINKGYVDQTSLVAEILPTITKTKNEYKEIENSFIKDIVNRLQSMAKDAIKKNYTISSNKVTQAMIDEAQNVLAVLITVDETDEFNKKLIELFSVIPRKMSRVQDYLASNKGDFGKIIEKEQDLLDVMKGQVIQSVVDETVENDIEQKPVTILEANGLIFEECTPEDIKKIKSCLGSCEDKFYKAWRVTNNKTQSKFDKFINDEKITNTKLLWHGSRNENWWSIINTGLILKPTNAVITGKLYGNGCYFAPKAQKSLGYTSLDGYWTKESKKSGFMALMDVAYGIPYDVYDFDSKYYNLNYNSLQSFKNGANCLHAHAGANLGYTRLRNDEIVVYKEDQMTIKYLVELR